MSVVTEQIGNGYDAYQVVLGPQYADNYGQNLKRIGGGEARSAWLVNGVVYKFGRDSANRHEHEVLSAWRATGATWAPKTTLWTGTDWSGGEYAIVAMEYLPDDGGPVDQETLAQIRRAAPQTCRENYVSHRGRTYLIDGGDVEKWPA